MTTPDEDNATITISNPANGETYKVAKLFDATVSTTTTDGESTSIAYTGTIPSTLSSYFEYVNGTDGTNGIKATDALVLSDTTVQAALKTWAEANVTNSAVSDGTKPLNFTGLPYGYYIITTTQGEALLTVDSTNPVAKVIDKNTTPPINNPTKTADDDDVFIGQTVTYTISFDTANFDEEKPITKYVIKDDFAEGVLTDVKVTSVKVGDTDIGTTTDGAYSIQFDANGKIEIPWVDVNGKSLYKNGAKLTITYTATVSASAKVDGSGNINTVILSHVTDGEPVPYEIPITETIYTYAIALQKVDQEGKPLAGAKFQLPFYVQETADTTDGAYIYAGTTAGTGLVNELTTPDSGLIIVKGVATGTYSITETEAPEGYNKLSDPVSVTAVKTGAETTNTTTYFDADGNQIDQHSETGFDVLVEIDELAATPIVVVNKTGTELPSTGGIGTTIFHVAGAALVLGAGIIMISKKRVNG